MTNLSPAGLVVDNRCLGGEFLVTDVGPYFGSAPQPRQDKQQKHKAKQSESGPQG